MCRLHCLVFLVTFLDHGLISQNEVKTVVEFNRNIQKEHIFISVMNYYLNQSRSETVAHQKNIKVSVKYEGVIEIKGACSTMDSTRSYLCFLHTLSILISLGSHNRTPQMRWLINNRNVFLTVLETGKFKIKVLADCGLVRAHLLVHRLPSFCCVLAWRKRKRALWSFFYKKLIPFMRAPPSWSNHLPKTPLPNVITLRVRIWTYRFWRDTNIDP